MATTIKQTEFGQRAIRHTREYLGRELNRPPTEVVAIHANEQGVLLEILSEQAKNGSVTAAAAARRLRGASWLPND